MSSPARQRKNELHRQNREPPCTARALWMLLRGGSVSLFVRRVNVAMRSISHVIRRVQLLERARLKGLAWPKRESCLEKR